MTDLNRAWFAACRRWKITPPLGEDGEPTGEGWLAVTDLDTPSEEAA